jgi:hypothetical protein
MSFIPSTKSELAVSNLAATIDYVDSCRRIHAVTPNWLAGQVDVFSQSLDSYVLAGGDPADLPLGVRASEVLVKAVADLLDSGYHLKPFVDTEWFMDTLNEVVLNVSAITESLDEGSYGVDLCDRFNAFMVRAEQEEDTF